jgi:hypothetical protein
MQRTVPTDELKQLPAHKRQPCEYEQRLSGLPVCSSKEKTTRSEELGDNRADNLQGNGWGGVEAGPGEDMGPQRRGFRTASSPPPSRSSGEGEKTIWPTGRRSSHHESFERDGISGEWLGEPEHLVDGRYTEQELTLTMAAGHRRAAWRILPAWSILGERERGYTPVGELPSRWRRGRSAQLAEDIPRRSGSIRGCRWWPCANLPASRLLLKLGGGGMAESTVSSTCRRWWSPYPWSTWTSRPLCSPLAVPPPCRRRRHHLTPSRCQATARSAPSSLMTKPDGGGSGCGRR